MMANAGPNTNGSQFFILTGSDILAKLNPPKYSLFGTVTEGLDVAEINGHAAADANATQGRAPASDHDHRVLRRSCPPTPPAADGSSPKTSASTARRRCASTRPSATRPRW